MAVPLIQVDAFTHRPFSGNPAAVCILPAWRDDAWLQAVAGEMNLSETAFVVPSEGGFDLRWFTPRVEVDLCGHATLATAHALWQEGYAEQGQAIHFKSRCGVLKAVPRLDEIELDFPATPPGPADEPPGLAETLNVPYTFQGKSQFDYLIEVESENTLRKLTPNMMLLAQIPMRGLIVTCRSEQPDFDFFSRFFAPASGVDEDPVCGSAHCCLGPFWQSRLGKSKLLAHQASARGGTVRVRVEGERVYLGGSAVVVMKGELLG